MEPQASEQLKQLKGGHICLHFLLSANCVALWCKLSPPANKQQLLAPNERVHFSSASTKSSKTLQSLQPVSHFISSLVVASHSVSVPVPVSVSLSLSFLPTVSAVSAARRRRSGSAIKRPTGAASSLLVPCSLCGRRHQKRTYKLALGDFFQFQFQRISRSTRTTKRRPNALDVSANCTADSLSLVTVPECNWLLH